MKETSGAANKNNKEILEEAFFIFRRKLLDTVREESIGLQYPASHIETLYFIAKKGNPSMKDIATHLKITPPSVTAIIETMQKKDLLIRVLSEKDRRTIRVTLTPKAWKLFRTFHEKKIAVLTSMLSKLDDTKQKQLITILTILSTE